MKALLRIAVLFVAASVLSAVGCRASVDIGNPQRSQISLPVALA